MLSVIIPAYNEEAVIKATTNRISAILQEKDIDYEILVIDDGSSDGTWSLIADLSTADKRITGIAFTRNFGKESAIYAGLAESNGDCAVVIDSDLQHPPEKIIEMYGLWQEGYEIVEGEKIDRGNDSLFHSISAKVFYYLISKAVGVDMATSSDFKLLDKKVVVTLLNMPERNAFFRALSSWVGYRTAKIQYSVQERSGGNSKWSTGSLIKYALTNISAFSAAPMQAVTILGIIVFAASLVLTIIAMIQKIQGDSLEGFTTVIILQCFTGSVIMMSLGIIGYYISKIYDEVKHRPKYIISRKTKK